MNKVVLLLRRKRNYELAEFWQIKEKISMWNETFVVPYFEMRRKLNDIAYVGLEKSDFDFVANFSDDWILDVISSMKDAWVVSLDDDDWISESLASRLRTFDSQKKMCFWNTAFFDQRSIMEGSPRFQITNQWNRQKGHNHGPQASCSYATRPELGTSVMLNHGLTKDVQGDFVEGGISFYVRSPLSVSFMKYWVKTPHDLISMCDGMKLLDESKAPMEFRRKIVELKNLFLCCNIRKIFI